MAPRRRRGWPMWAVFLGLFLFAVLMCSTALVAPLFYKSPPPQLEIVWEQLDSNAARGRIRNVTREPIARLSLHFATFPYYGLPGDYDRKREEDFAVFPARPDWANTDSRVLNPGEEVAFQVPLDHLHELDFPTAADVSNGWGPGDSRYVSYRYRERFGNQVEDGGGPER